MKSRLVLGICYTRRINNASGSTVAWYSWTANPISESPNLGCTGQLLEDAPDEDEGLAPRDSSWEPVRGGRGPFSYKIYN